MDDWVVPPDAVPSTGPRFIVMEGMRGTYRHKHIVALVQLSDDFVGLPKKAEPSARGVKRIVLRKKTTSNTHMDKHSLALATVCRILHERPLSVQAAELDGDAGVRAFVASLLREIEDGG